MTKSNLFNFDELAFLEEYYSPEPFFYEPFYEFHSKFSTLYRYFHVNHKIAREFVAESRRSLIRTQSLTHDAAEIDIHMDITLSDIEYYMDFLYSSVLTQLFSMYENLLVETINMLKTDLSIDPDTTKENIPLVNKYLKWLNNHAGLDVKLSKEITKKFDVLREVRNRFVHSHVRPIPHQMTKTMDEIQQKVSAQGLHEYEGLVLEAFKTIGQAAKIVELGVVNKFHPRGNNKK